MHPGLFCRGVGCCLVCPWDFAKTKSFHYSDARSIGKGQSILPSSFHPSRGGSARVTSKHAQNDYSVLRHSTGSGLPVLLSRKTEVEDTESSRLSGTPVVCVCLGFVLFSLQIQSPSEALPLTEEG